MSTIDQDLAALETHISTLNRVAGKIAPAKMQEGHEWLVRLAQKIKSPNQSNNATYYNLGAPVVHEVGDAEPKVHTVEASSTHLSFDVFKQNSVLAGDILSKSQETVEKIERLASAGKKFNAAKAKADVHAVTSKVAGILREVDLTKDWVRGDLEKLAAQADKLHGLFATAKV